MTTMNKREAAEFLGKSTRRIAEYVSRGKLKATYINGKTGKEAAFDPEELKRLKEEMETPSVRASVQTEEIDKTPAVILEKDLLPRLLAALQEPRSTECPVHVKPILRITEASALTGLSRMFLLTALKEGRLKGKNNTLGRGWRIKRADLDQFIAKA